MTEKPSSPSVKRAPRWTMLLPLLPLVVFAAWQGYQRLTEKPKRPYSAWLQEVQEKPENVKKVQLEGSRLIVEYKDPASKETIAGPSEFDNKERSKLFQALSDNGIPYGFSDKETSLWWSLLSSWLPTLLLLAGGIFFFRFLMQGGPMRGLPNRKARVKTLDPDRTVKTTFADVAGIEEAKEEVQELVDFLKDPQKFTKLGGKIPKGVLLTGPPGTGKTLLARAVAGEANVPFFSMSGSEFDEILVGMGASRMRDLFEQAQQNAPCIVFIDEIDAIGRQRNNRMRGGPGEEQTLNQLLVEMDGFAPNEGVILVGATNRPDVLDPALLRPGRFDRHIVVSLPDVRGREQILRVHTRNIPMAEDVNLSILARGTPGFSGAELASVINEAALLAARRNKDLVDARLLEEAKSKVLMGPERRSLVISDKEKRITAYHESGHALAAHLLPEADPVHLVTIIPRGRALGVTQQLPIEDRMTTTKTWIESRIAVCMGGRAAEELVFGHFSTGASNDIEQATELARLMVCEWGMSEKLGPLHLGSKNKRGELDLTPDFSPETARLIDEEIRAIVSSQYTRVRTLLVTERSKLDRMVEALLEHETLHADQLKTLLDESTS